MSFFRFAFLCVLLAFSSVFAAPKVVLFNDTSAWYHWGCTGTSTALKKGIQDLGFEIEAISIAQTKMFQEIPPFEEFDDSKKFEKFSQENKEIIETIRNASAVVITGEGTLHDLRKGPQTLLYIAHISKKFLQKHVEIINHSAYPKDDQTLIGPFAEKGEEELERANSIYKNVYDKLDFIAIREPISQRVMEEIGISSTLSFDCLPLYIRDHYSTKKCVESKTAVLSGSVAFSATGLENICRYLEALSKEGYEIKVLIGAAAFPSEDDKLFVNFLRRHCKAPWKLIFASSMQEWLDTFF